VSKVALSKAGLTKSTQKSQKTKKTLHYGARMRIPDANPKLNGKVGRVIGFDGSHVRLLIDVDGKGTMVMTPLPPSTEYVGKECGRRRRNAVKTDFQTQTARDRKQRSNSETYSQKRAARRLQQAQQRRRTRRAPNSYPQFIQYADRGPTPHSPALFNAMKSLSPHNDKENFIPGCSPDQKALSVWLKSISPSAILSVESVESVSSRAPMETLFTASNY